MKGIYKIENLLNGKVYIGQSTDIDQRWRCHKADLRHNNHGNSHLQNSWDKYGEDNFSFEIIEECKEEELSDREIYWINEYNSYDRSYGYNLTLGGPGTRMLHPVLQFDLSGHFIQEWPNGIMAADQLNIGAGTIYGCINKRYKHAGRFIWLYKEDYKDESSLSWYLEDQSMQNVLQYDLYGNLLKKWTCCAEIVKELKFNPIQCLLHITKSCKGYIFKYANDQLEITPEYCSYVRNIFHTLNAKSFYQINKDAEIVKHFNSLNEAVSEGWCERCISECCNGKREIYKNYLWVYDADLDKINKEYCDEIFNKDRSSKYYKVRQYDQDYNLIKEYPYLAKVMDDGFNDTNVRDACLGRINYKGYIWEFGEEVENPTCKAVLQYDLFGKLLNRFSSVSSAADATGLHSTSIAGACNHNYLTSGNYIFKFEDDDDFKITEEYCKYVREKSQFYFKPIACLSFDDELIKIYNSRHELEQDCFDISEVRKCCRNKKPYYKNYHWAFLEDYDYSMLSA